MGGKHKRLSCGEKVPNSKLQVPNIPVSGLVALVIL